MTPREFTTTTDRDEWTSLTARERDLLAALSLAPIRYAVGRNMPEAYRALIAQGLAFRSHVGITITDKGREVAERVR